MKKVITILSLVVLVGGAAIAYFMNGTARILIDKHLLGKMDPPPPAVIEPERWVYVLADGTGSTNTTYAIPKVTKEWLSEMLTTMYQQTGGKLFLSHIDKDSRNNQVLYLAVPKQISIDQEPIRESGEVSFDFQKRLTKWRESVAKAQKDSTATAKEFQLRKQEFLTAADEFLNTKVYIKSPDNNWTDVIGILNASFITLENDNTSKAKKYVVGFSDFVQDAPHLKSMKLDSIPVSVQLMAVNPVQNSSRKITDQVTEYEHPNRVTEIIFQTLK